MHDTYMVGNAISVYKARFTKKLLLSAQYLALSRVKFSNEVNFE